MTELRTALEKALRQAMIGNVHVICDRLEQVDIEFAAIASELAASAVLRPHLGLGDAERAIGEAQRDIAEALRMATQAGIGFEQGMPNARRLAADADRKATEAFRQLRAIVGRGEGEGGGDGAQ